MLGQSSSFKKLCMVVGAVQVPTSNVNKTPFYIRSQVFKKFLYSSCFFFIFVA